MTEKKRLFLSNLTWFLVPFLVPFLILGTLLIIVTTNLRMREAENELIHSSNVFETQLENPFLDIEVFIQDFEGNPSLINLITSLSKKDAYSFEEARSYKILLSSIATSTNTKRYFDSIYVYYKNSSNKFLTSTNGMVYDNNYWDTEWINDLEGQEDLRFFTRVRNIKRLQADQGGTDVISLFVHNDAYKGWEVFNMSLSYFERQVETLFKDKGVSAILFDETDTPVLTYGCSYDEFEAPIPTTGDSVGTIMKSGQRCIYLKRDLQRFGWSFAVIRTESSILNLMKSLILLVISALVLSATIGLVLAIMITVKNNRWIHDITYILDNPEDLSNLKYIRKGDPYAEIVHNVLQVFIEKKYLQDHKRSMELIALQAQISPHFLYNTLNMIYWETIKLGKGPSLATEMLERLTNIIEYSITKPLSSVSLSEEIQYTKDYIEIQRQRFANKFSVEWHIECDIENKSFMKLFFQPIIENSISHGFVGINYRGVIDISIKDVDGAMLVSIKDNGTGIPPEKLSELKAMVQTHTISDMDSIGLPNTMRRMKLFYGDNARVDIISDGNGTEITFLLPNS